MFLIYKITNPHTLKAYVGYTKHLHKRITEHKYLNTVQCQDFTVEVLFENIPSRAEACEMEKVFIHIHNTFYDGYNKTRGGSRGTEVSEETKQKLSIKASENNRKRVADGSHPFLGGEIQRESNKKRVADGSHPFLGGEIQRESNKKRVADGSHHWLGGKIVGEISRRRVADGTHNFLDKAHQSRASKIGNKKRWAKYRERQRETRNILAEVLYYHRLSWWRKNKDWLQTPLGDYTKAEQLSLFSDN